MATIYTDETTPPPEEFLHSWLKNQYWGTEEPLEILGSYRFVDDQGLLDFEGFIFNQGERSLHIPVTYHTEPKEGSEDYLIAIVEHPAGGTRWVYDALADPVAVHVLNLALAGEVQQAEHHLYRADGQYLGSEVPSVTVLVRGDLPDEWGYVSAHHTLIEDDDTNPSELRRLVANWGSGWSATIFELTPPQPATKDDIDVTATQQDDSVN